MKKITKLNKIIDPHRFMAIDIMIMTLFSELKINCSEELRL